MEPSHLYFRGDWSKGVIYPSIYNKYISLILNKIFQTNIQLTDNDDQTKKNDMN